MLDQIGSQNTTLDGIGSSPPPHPNSPSSALQSDQDDQVKKIRLIEKIRPKAKELRFEWKRKENTEITTEENTGNKSYEKKEGNPNSENKRYEEE